jgi:glycosyltransferase involved in cell wall biosynthesis
LVVSDVREHCDRAQRAARGDRTIRVFHRPSGTLRHDPVLRLAEWADVLDVHIEESIDTELINVLDSCGKSILVSGRPDLGLANQVVTSRGKATARDIKRANNATDISIIIPTFNTDASLVERALDSVFAQQSIDELTYDIVVVDDASDVPVVDRLSPAYLARGEVTVVRNTRNKGLGLSRNIGFQRSKGTRVCFLDADDYLGVAFIAGMMDGLETASVVLGRMVVHHEGEGKFEENNYMSQAVETLKLARRSIDPILLAVSACVKGYRREVIDCGRLTFNVGFHEDIYPWIRFLVANRPGRLGFSESAIYYRTIRPGSGQITLNPGILTQRLKDLIATRQTVVTLLQANNEMGEYDELIARYTLLNQGDTKRLVASETSADSNGLRKPEAGSGCDFAMGLHEPAFAEWRA